MPNNEASSSSLQISCLLFVLVLAALLRFYALGTPSMWWDEIYNIPLTAPYPLTYILEWCRRIEIQPPYFCLAMKPFLTIWQSDFALRFPFALAGLATVAMTYRLGCLVLGPSAGLGAAALVAFNPLTLWLSRTLRPYSLLHLGLTASLILFIRAFDNGRRRAEAGLYAVNLAMLLLHYSTLLMVGAEFVVLVIWHFFPRRQGDWRAVVRFGLVSLLSFAPSAPFFFTNMVEGHKVEARSSFLTVATTVTQVMGKILVYFGLPWAGWAIVGLALLGAGVLWFKSPKTTALFVLSAFLPPAAIVAKRYDYHIFPAHLTFVIIPLAVLVGGTLVLFRRQTVGVLLVMVFAISSTWWALGPAYGDFYTVASYDHRIFRLGVFKDIARAAPDAIGNSPVLCPDLTQYNPINWYLNRDTTHNPLVDQHLDRARKVTDLMFWCGFDNFGHLANDRAAFLARYPDAKPQPSLDTIRVYWLRIARQPLTVADVKPSVLHLDAAPEHFYRDVAALSGVMLSPYFGNAVIPTSNDVWGSFEYDILNASPEPRPAVTLVARYSNTGRENLVEVEYRLDGGPWQSAVVSHGPDPTEVTVVHLKTDRPWHVLSVRCRLWCAPLTPLSGGSNLTTVTFRGLDLYLCRQGNMAECESRLAADILPQGFPAVQGPEQMLGEMSNVTLHQAPESPGWGYYAPIDPTQPGEIKLHLAQGGKALVFYPRSIGLQSAIMADVSGSVNSLRGLQDAWTPLGLALPLPGGLGPGEVLFRLEGVSAQLWSRDGQLVFAMPSWTEKTR